MRKVRVLAKTKVRAEDFWDKIVDVKNWDKLIKFVKKIYISQPVKEGVIFYDVTTILLLPVKIKHTIIKIDKYKNFFMEAYLPFDSGKMYQTIEIKKQDNISTVNIEIKFQINNFILDLIFGPILKRRLRQMIVETLQKVRDDLVREGLKRDLVKKSEIIYE